MPSTVCWILDARTTSASPDPERGWGQFAHLHDPCNTAAQDGTIVSKVSRC